MKKNKNIAFLFVAFALLFAVVFSEVHATPSSNPQDLIGVWRVSGHAEKYKSQGKWNESPAEPDENYFYEFNESTYCVGGLLSEDKIVQPCPEIYATPYRISGSTIITEEREGPETKQQWKVKDGKLELLSSDPKGSYKIILTKVSVKSSGGDATPTLIEELSQLKCDGKYYQFRVGPAEIIRLVTVYADPEILTKLDAAGFLYEKVEVANNEKGYTDAPLKYSYYVDRDLDGEGVIGKSGTQTDTIGSASVWLTRLSTVNPDGLRDLGIQGDHFWNGSNEGGGKGADFAFSCEFTQAQEFKRGENPCVETGDGLQCDNLEESLKDPANVTELTLHYESDGNVPRLTKFPKKIGKMVRLKSLSINEQGFQKIPAAVFKNLKNLQSLSITQTPLANLPKSIGKLQNLSSLTVQMGGLQKIPAAIGNLKKLSSLDLSYNQIRAVPKEMAKLKNIYVINLSNNQITDLPDEWTALKLSDEYLGESKGGFAEDVPGANLVQVNLMGNPIDEAQQASIKQRFHNLNIRFSEADPYLEPG